MTPDTVTEEAPLDLSGKVVLVTGATRGLGLAVARKLCTTGCEVLLNYAHDDAAADEAARSLAGLGGKAYLARADVSRPEGVAQLLDGIRRTHGQLDVLVHNAAAFHRMPATAPEADSCDLDRAVALGPLVHGIGQLAELLPSGGRIIAISSTGARSVVPGYVSLGMAKAALESLVRYLAADFARRGITVNTVAAGKLDKGTGTDPDGIAARIVARTPAGRLTVPEDVANVVALLCRREASWIHGQVITVDGGLGLLA